MNKVQKKIHQLTLIILHWRNQEGCSAISYREVKCAWRKEIKIRKYSEKDLIQKPIIDII